MKSKKLTIEDIRQISWAGNHFQDCKNFEMVRSFAGDSDNVMSERAEACRIAAKQGMGIDCDSGLSDEQVVADYFREV
jgi:hypothetical protein